MSTEHGGRSATGGARRWVAAQGLPAAFWYLWIATVLNQAGSFVILYLAVYLSDVRGLSAAFTGLVVGLSYGVGGMIGTLAGGALADRVGRRATLLGANLACAGCTVTLGLVHQPFLILLLGMGVGTAGNAVRPVVATTVIDLTTESNRVRAFALQYWANNLGFAAAAMVMGFAAHRNPLLLFLLDAATMLLMAGIVAVKVPESRHSPEPGDTTPAGVPGPHAGWRTDGFGAVLTNVPFMSMVILTVLFASIFMQHISMLPIAMRQTGMSTADYGWMIALNAALIVLGQLRMARAIAERRSSRVLALAAAAMGGGFALVAPAHTLPLFALSTVVWSVGEMLHAAAAPTVVAALSPAHLRGRYQGLFAFAFPTAALIGPVAGGWVMQRVGGPPLWFGCLALGLLAAVGHLWAEPSRERRVAEVRAQASATDLDAPEASLSSG